ncbi:MAG: 30S ribosomal protein S17 [Thermoanaerobaculia bacterium]
MNEQADTESTAQAEPAAAVSQSGGRQTMVGTVVSDKMDKTVVVSVGKTTVHRLYRRYLKRTKKYYAHDEQNQCGVGDVVEIVACRPLSKQKRWRVGRIVEKAEG